MHKYERDLALVSVLFLDFQARKLLKIIEELVWG